MSVTSAFYRCPLKILLKTDLLKTNLLQVVCGGGRGSATCKGALAEGHPRGALLKSAESVEMRAPVHDA